MERTLMVLVFGVISFLFAVSCVESGVVARSKRQEWCDPNIRYGSIEGNGNHSVIATCRYYGDRFYECTAWNRLVARNHWILSDGIIPQEMWLNEDERVRIAECKFFSYDNLYGNRRSGEYRCRHACVSGTCGRKCPWGGRYEGTPTAGFKESAEAETNTVAYDIITYSYPNVQVYRQVDSGK